MEYSAKYVHSLIKREKPCMRKHEGCIWILYLLTIYLKCKTFEIFLIEFILLCLFYNCIILFLHIEGFYKVGD